MVVTGIYMIDTYLQECRCFGCAWRFSAFQGTGRFITYVVLGTYLSSFAAMALHTKVQIQHKKGHSSYQVDPGGEELDTSAALQVVHGVVAFWRLWLVPSDVYHYYYIVPRQPVRERTYGPGIVRYLLCIYLPNFFNLDVDS